MYRIKIVSLVACIMLLYTHDLQAGVKQWIAQGATVAAKQIPFLKNFFEENEKRRLEHKISHIQEQQESGLDQLREMSKKAIKTKEKVEKLFYFKEQSQRTAESLLQDFSMKKTRRFLGVLIADRIGVPINPADYIPDTVFTKNLKKNLDLDLTLPPNFIQAYRHFFRDTRASLLDDQLDQQHPRQFNQAYEKALHYEEELSRALSAKEHATLQVYKEDIAHLQEEIVALEAIMKTKGLTVSEVVQIQLAIDNKHQRIHALHEKINQGIRAGMQLTDEQKIILGQQKAQKDTEALVSFLDKERARIRQKYGHLWKFW